MIETHPFGFFVPHKTKYLILGSFTTKEAYDNVKKKDYVWFYSNGGRNMFWPIMEIIYGKDLKTRKQMQDLFNSKKIALADIILQCERRKNSNLDIHLANVVYAVKDITNIVKNNPVQKILFSSRYVEKMFKKKFKDLIAQYQDIELITLPSPSPRYAAMTQKEKIKRYKEVFSNIV